MKKNAVGRIRWNKIRRGLTRKWLWILFGMGIVIIGTMIFSMVRTEQTTKWVNPKKENRKPPIYLTVLKSKEALPMGAILSPTEFEQVSIEASVIPEGSVREPADLKGKRTAKEIGKNEILKQVDMVEEHFFFKPDDRLIEQGFSPEGIPSDCRDGSIIDIRLFQPSGNDPIVLSKVFVMKRVENKLTMYVDQREQELLKQAVKEGALYILLYADPSQEPTEVDYIPDYSAKNINQMILSEDKMGDNQ